MILECLAHWKSLVLMKQVSFICMAIIEHYKKYIPSCGRRKERLKTTAEGRWGFTGGC